MISLPEIGRPSADYAPARPVFPAQAPTLEALLHGAAGRLSLPSGRLEEPSHRLTAVHTLGPERTSSHLATLDLLSRAGMADQVAVTLHDSFEEILAGAERGWEPHDGLHLALVPSAFAGANAFFMHARTRLVGCFCHDTPPYHLAWAPERGDPLRAGARLRVATHPAPIGLLARLLGEDVGYEVAPYLSTVAAAKAALAGEADVALCNLETIRERRMAHDPRGLPIAMTWNLFVVGTEESP